MKTRQTLLAGLAGLGFVLALPAQAAPDYPDGSFVVVMRDGGDEARQDQRQDRRDPRKSRQKSKQVRETEQPQGYGYGYERRQQEQFPSDGGYRGRR